MENVMFSKIKKFVMYVAVVMLPVGLLGIALKFFYDKKEGKDVTVDEAIADGVAFTKKFFKMFA